jgi:septum site-determining protein MinD
MTGSVLAVVGTKGGVGTTTTAVNLAAALDTAGVDAVVVDADLELPDVAAYLGVTHRPTVHAVLAGVATVEEAVVPGREVPGAASMAVLPGRRDLRAYRAADPRELETVLERLRTVYDVVVVDTPAGLDDRTGVGPWLADGTVLVTTADGVAVGDANPVTDLVAAVDGTVTGVVVTDTTDAATGERVAAGLDTDCLGTVPPGSDADDRTLTMAYRRLAAAVVELGDGLSLEDTLARVKAVTDDEDDDERSRRRRTGRTHEQRNDPPRGRAER